MTNRNFILDAKACQAWQEFLRNENNLGHATRCLSADRVDEHVEACWKSAINTVDKLKRDIVDLKPKLIVEVGCSAGMICYALQAMYPESEVIGIDPEREAINVASSMMNDAKQKNLKFHQGVGESLPFLDESVDLIICHTVIEHVHDVGACIKEMARVLSPQGVIHIEAPNYRFPYEPHLAIYTIPELGKPFVKFTALLQGKWHQRGFVDHLKFVTPAYLENFFLKNGFVWHNRAIEKMKAATMGGAEVKKYHAAKKTLMFLHRFGIANLTISIIVHLGYYPSILYTLKKIEK